MPVSIHHHHRPRMGSSGRDRPFRLTWTGMGICLFALVLLLTSHMFINEEIEALSSHVEKLSAEMVGADEGLTGASEERKKKNNGEPAKILVFGMHHSGTSGVVRLLAEMGAWAGKGLTDF